MSQCFDINGFAYSITPQVRQFPDTNSFNSYIEFAFPDHHLGDQNFPKNISYSYFNIDGHDQEKLKEEWNKAGEIYNNQKGKRLISEIMKNGSECESEEKSLIIRSSTFCYDFIRQGMRIF
jgi:hypothetical protein